MKIHLPKVFSLGVSMLIGILLMGFDHAAAFGTIILNFDGQTRDEFSTRDQTPDMSGAVGLNYFIQAANDGGIAAYDKTTGILEDSRGAVYGFFDDGFAGSALACENQATFIGQPQVHYDHMSARWFVAAVAADDIDNGPYYQCVAMTNQSLPAPGISPDFMSGNTDTYWNMYQIEIHADYLPDEPKFGIWPDGIYMAADLFDVDNNGLARTPKGVALWVFNRDDLTTGAVSIRTRNEYISESFGYQDLLPANLIGDPPPAGTPGYFASILPPNQFLTWEFDVDWTNPSHPAFDPLAVKTTSVSSFSWPIGHLAPQSGSAENLDIQGQKLMQPLQYRHYVNNVVQPSMWANHTVTVDDGTTGIRWYELRNPSDSTPQVYQQGTFKEEGDSLYRWLGSMAVDGQGNMAIAYSRSSATTTPAIYQTGRLVNDPLGELQTETLFHQGSGPQDQIEIGTETDGEWGRYSHMSVDPYDDCNFWYTNQFYTTASATEWNTRITNFSLVDCETVNQGTNTRLNLHTDGTQALNGGSGIYDVDISDDGRYVVFDSEADNLVDGDTNGLVDVFLRDRDADGNGIFDETTASSVTTTRISVGVGSAEANGHSGVGINGDQGGTTVSISGDGRFIAFPSNASNLIANDTNGTTDVFVYDRIADTMIRAGSVQGNAVSDQPAVASVGNTCRVVFRSFANNMVANDTNGVSDVFHYNCLTNVTTMVSITSGGGLPDAPSYTPSISADGQEIAFTSEADLTSADDNAGESDIYLRDLDLALSVTLISTGTGGAADARAYSPSISGDGSRIVFASEADDLVAGDINGVADIFLRDLGVPDTTLVSVDALGNQTNGESFHPEISTDGTQVALETLASNIVSGDNNGLRDIYLYDLSAANDPRQVTFDFDGGPANGASFWPALDSTGRHVVYSSNANNLVNDDTNNLRDIFAFDRDGIPPLGPILYIPQGTVPAVLAGQITTVPIRFNDNNAGLDYISSVAFTIDLNNACLSFDSTDSNTDGIPDSVSFTLPAGFVGTATYNATDLQLEVTAYDPTAPLATIPDDSDIVSIDFQTICQPPVDGSQFVLVSFDNTPAATFGNNLGQSVAGSTLNGAIEVEYNAAGDCNGDGRVDAGDISALILEIFDGDSTVPADAPNGTFDGDPVGCNPNADAEINAGDISCEILIIFNGLDGILTCLSDSTRGAIPTAGLNSLRNSVEFMPAREILDYVATQTALEISTVDYDQSSSTSVAVSLDPAAAAVNATTFSLNYDETKLSFDDSDTNQDGLPDSMKFNLPAGYQVAITHDANDTAGEIDIAIFTLSPSGNTLSRGDLVEVTFDVAAEADSFASVAFSQTPPPSLGSASGASIPLDAAEDGGIQLTLNRLFELFLPLVISD
ncbi:MAG: hypothetical protein AAF902_06510 [Chloroflexota bacterium]